MRYKMTKKYQIRHQICFFFKLKMHQIPLSVGTRWGAYDAPQGPLVAWGRPLPISPSTLLASRSHLGATAPRFSGPLNTKSWLRQCFHSGRPTAATGIVIKTARPIASSWMENWQTAQNLVGCFSAKSLKLLPPAVKCQG